MKKMKLNVKFASKCGKTEQVEQHETAVQGEGNQLAHDHPCGTAFSHNDPELQHQIVWPPEDSMVKHGTDP